MVLRQMVAVNAGAVVGFDQRETVSVKLCERHARIVHVVEDTEFHATHPSQPAHFGQSLIRSRMPTLIQVD
jgi:hypothetical protein